MFHKTSFQKANGPDQNCFHKATFSVGLFHKTSFQKANGPDQNCFHKATFSVGLFHKTSFQKANGPDQNCFHKATFSVGLFHKTSFQKANGPDQNCFHKATFSVGLFQQELFSKELFQQELFSEEPFSKELFSKELFQQELFSKELFQQELFSEEPFSKELFSKELFQQELFSEEPFSKELFSKELFQQELFSKELFQQELFLKELLFEVTISMCLFYFIKAPIWSTPAIFDCFFSTLLHFFQVPKSIISCPNHLSKQQLHSIKQPFLQTTIPPNNNSIPLNNRCYLVTILPNHNIFATLQPQNLNHYLTAVPCSLFGTVSCLYRFMFPPFRVSTVSNPHYSTIPFYSPSTIPKPPCLQSLHVSKTTLYQIINIGQRKLCSVKELPTVVLCQGTDCQGINHVKELTVKE